MIILPNIDLKAVCDLSNLYKEKTKESLSKITQTIRVLDEQEKLNQEMKTIIKSIFKAPKRFTFLEKIIFYYNRKKGLTLQEIADITGYSLQHLREVSAKINKKLSKTP